MNIKEISLFISNINWMEEYHVMKKHFEVLSNNKVQVSESYKEVTHIVNDGEGGPTFLNIRRAPDHNNDRQQPLVSKG